MPTTTRPVRHREVAGTFYGGTFQSSRTIRDAGRIKPAPKPKAAPRSTRDATAAATTTLTRMASNATAVTARMQDTGDSLDRIAAGLRTIADRRRAMAGAGDPSTGIHRFNTSGAVQAANAARWGRV